MILKAKDIRRMVKYIGMGYTHAYINDDGELVVMLYSEYLNATYSCNVNDGTIIIYQGKPGCNTGHTYYRGNDNGIPHSMTWIIGFMSGHVTSHAINEGKAP